MAKANSNKNTEVAETQQAPLVSAEMPSYLAEMQGGKRVNQDNFDATDIVVPRVKLLQALSEECESHNNAKAGMFWHTGYDKDLGTEIDFVVCSRRKKYLLVAPLEDGQGILARAEDAVTWDQTGSWQVKIKGVKTPVTWEIKDRDVAASGLLNWGTSNPDDKDSPPAATLFYEYLVILPSHIDLGPMVMSLTRSQIRKARKGLNDKIKLHEGNGRPMQALVFRAKAVDDKNADGNAFKNWHFTGNGFASEALYKQAKELGGMMATYRVQDEGVPDDESAARSGDAPKSTEY